MDPEENFFQGIYRLKKTYFCMQDSIYFLFIQKRRTPEVSTMSEKVIVLEEGASNVNWSWKRLFLEKCSFKWVVDNFNSNVISKKPGESINSPLFNPTFVDELQFYISLYPSGEDAESENFLSLFLCTNKIIGSKFRLRIDFSLSIKNGNNKNSKNKVLSATQWELGASKGTGGRGFPNFLDKKLVTDHKKLIIVCEITSIEVIDKLLCEPSYELNSYQPVKKVKCLECNLLDELFNNDEYKDVTFVVQDQQIKAHKSIICTSSPVFKTMFASNIKEKVSNAKTISDTTPELFTEVLRFIYLNRVENLETLAQDLLPLANKYMIDDLKDLCERSLFDQIDENNVLEFLVFADVYNAESLNNKLLTFIRSHKYLTKTKEFDEKIISHPMLMAKTLQFLVCIK